MRCECLDSSYTYRKNHQNRKYALLSQQVTWQHSGQQISQIIKRQTVNLINKINFYGRFYCIVSLGRIFSYLFFSILNLALHGISSGRKINKLLLKVSVLGPANTTFSLNRFSMIFQLLTGNAIFSANTNNSRKSTKLTTSGTIKCSIIRCWRNNSMQTIWLLKSKNDKWL